MAEYCGIAVYECVSAGPNQAVKVVAKEVMVDAIYETIMNRCNFDYPETIRTDPFAYAFSKEFYPYLGKNCVRTMLNFFFSFVSDKRKPNIITYNQYNQNNLEQQAIDWHYTDDDESSSDEDDSYF